MDALSTILWVVTILVAIGVTAYLTIKFVVKTEVPPPKETPKPQPEPDVGPMASGWGYGPWGEDPWTHAYTPDVPGVTPGPTPGPAPGPPADNFKPLLTFMSAHYDPVGRQILVKYKILPNGSVPVNKSYSIAFTVLSGGEVTSDIPEDEPLSSAEMSGLQQESLVGVTNVPADVKASDLTVSGQIQYRENGTLNKGTVGVPTTIQAK
jgi:hypothetical protein